MKFQFVAAVGVVSLLGACGGGGGSGISVPEFATVQEALAANAANELIVDGLELTPGNEIPSSGSATYEGVFAILDEDSTDLANASVTGGIAVRLDFGDNDASEGEAGNFFDTAGTEVDGSLTLSNFEFAQEASGGGFVADVDGQLSNVGPTGIDADYDYNLEAGGLFQGDEVAVITILGSGSVSEVGSSEERQVTGGANIVKQ